MSISSQVLVRIRGQIGVKGNISMTLKYLNLFKKFNATIIPYNDKYEGMIKKTKDYITWGPLTPELAKELLLKEVRLSEVKLLHPNILLKRQV